MPSSVAYDAILGAVNLRQVRSSTFSPGNTIAPDFVSGGIDPAALFFTGAQPSATFQTNDVSGVVTGIHARNGLYVNNGTIAIPYNLRANGGTFAAAGNHHRIRGSYGLTVINSITANHGDQDGAMVDLATTFVSSDGMTAPVVVDDGQTLQAQAYNASHSLGPQYVNSSLLSSVVGITITAGITTELETTDGNLFPREVHITRVQPVIDIRFRNVAALKTHGPLFNNLTAFTGYLRKRSPGGSFVAANVSEHISFVVGADGIIDCQPVNASGNSPIEPSFRIHCKSLTLSATAAIPS